MVAAGRHRRERELPRRWTPHRAADAPTGLGTAMTSASVSRDHCTSDRRSIDRVHPAARRLALSHRAAAAADRGDDHRSPTSTRPPPVAVEGRSVRPRRAGDRARRRPRAPSTTASAPVAGHRRAPRLPTGAIERPDAAARRRHDDTCCVGGCRGWRVVERHRPLRVARRGRAPRTGVRRAVACEHDGRDEHRATAMSFRRSGVPAGLDERRCHAARAQLSTERAEASGTAAARSSSAARAARSASAILDDAGVRVHA